MSGVGIIVAGIAWLIVISLWAGNEVSCSTSYSCGSKDLVFAAIIGVVMLVPARFLAEFITAALPNK